MTLIPEAALRRGRFGFVFPALLLVAACARPGVAVGPRCDAGKATYRQLVAERLAARYGDAFVSRDMIIHAPAPAHVRLGSGQEVLACVGRVSVRVRQGDGASFRRQTFEYAILDDAVVGLTELDAAPSPPAP